MLMTSAHQPSLVAYGPACYSLRHGRSVAQPGSALVWGTRGRGFKSRRSDQNFLDFKDLMGSPASLKQKVLAFLRPAPPAAPSGTVQSAQRATLQTRLLGGTLHGFMSALAAICAYVPTHLLGLHQGFWGAITAIGVVQTEFHASESTARNQFRYGSMSPRWGSPCWRAGR
jgi:hypothetical protein